MATLTEVELLRLWEVGLGQSSAARALTLAAAACDEPLAALADAPLGERDALLLSLRESCFGGDLQCEVDCPGCGERLGTGFCVADVRMSPRPEVVPDRIEVAGVTARFRPLTSRDLLAIDPAQPDARQRLASSCVLDSSVAVDSLPPEAVEAVAAALGEADPQADIVLSLDCSSCGHAWTAPFDVASYLWIEVDSYVRRLLLEVRALALAYGWTEADALAVSPTRRRFYLERAPL
jgi:hypothetical protein